VCSFARTSELIVDSGREGGLMDLNRFATRLLNQFFSSDPFLEKNEWFLKCVYEHSVLADVATIVVTISIRFVRIFIAWCTTR
jgi:hypothetical protein